MGIDEAIEKFHDYIATERRMAAGTVRNYISDLQDFAAWLQRQEVTTVEELTAREVREWQMEHMERGEAAGTVKRRLSSLSAWFLYMRRHGLCDRDVMAKVSAPRLPKRLPVFFKESETEHLYDAGLFADDFMKEYFALKQQEKGDSECLFVNRKGERISVDEVYRVVKKYMNLLSHADRISPHVFRHSFATHILNEGGNIQAISELLGHADLSTTEVYTHVSRAHLKEVYKHAHPRGKKKE